MWMPLRQQACQNSGVQKNVDYCNIATVKIMNNNIIKATKSQVS
jgi:hypothetical protein